MNLFSILCYILAFDNAAQYQYKINDFGSMSSTFSNIIYIGYSVPKFVKYANKNDLIRLPHACFIYSNDIFVILVLDLRCFVAISCPFPQLSSSISLPSRLQ